MVDPHSQVGVPGFRYFLGHFFEEKVTIFDPQNHPPNPLKSTFLKRRAGIGQKTFFFQFSSKTRYFWRNSPFNIRDPFHGFLAVFRPLFRRKSDDFLKNGLKSTGNLGPPPGSVGPPKRVPPSELFVINFVGEVRSGGGPEQ